jgi:hypothetical protein
MGDGKIRDGRRDPRSARAVARRKELRDEDGAEVKRICDHLLMTLRREPTIEDVLKAQLIGRTAVKITRLAERRRESLPERQLLESLLRTPFNAPGDTSGGPRKPGQKYFVVTKGDGFVAKGGDPAADEAAVTDEVS